MLVADRPFWHRGARPLVALAVWALLELSAVGNLAAQVSHAKGRDAHNLCTSDCSQDTALLRFSVTMLLVRGMLWWGGGGWARMGA